MENVKQEVNAAVFKIRCEVAAWGILVVFKLPHNLLYDSH